MYQQAFPHQPGWLLALHAVSMLTVLATLGLVCLTPRAPQWLRWLALVSSSAMGVATMAWPVYEYGLHRTSVALSDARQTGSAYGWMVTVAFYAAWSLPLVALLVAVRIHRRPSTFGAQGVYRRPASSSQW